MDGFESYILPNGIKASLDKIFNSYNQDKVRIRERIDLFLKYRHAGYSLQKIQTLMMDPSTNPPILMRISMSLGLGHKLGAVSEDKDPEDPGINENRNVRLWTISEIAIVLQRHRTTTHYNFSGMEDSPAYKDKLESIRTEILRRKKKDSDETVLEYGYTEEVFDLLLDYFSRQCVARRVIAPNYETEPQAPYNKHAVHAIWEYWNSLITTPDNFSFQKVKPPTRDLSFMDEGCNSLIYTKEADEDDLTALPQNILSGAELPKQLPSINASEIPVRIKRLLKDCISIVCTNKFLSAAAALLVNLADLKGNDIRAFYIVPAIIAPAIVVMFYKARGEADVTKRKKYTTYLAYGLVAAVVWGFSFSGRALNGDLSESALPDMAQKIERLAKQQDETAADVAKISAKIGELEEKAEVRAEVRKSNVTGFIADARVFINRASEDMSGIDPYDYERMIEGCTKMLDTMPLGMPEERVQLLIAQGDLYQLWGMTDSKTAYSKYENAVAALTKASKIENISDSAYTTVYAGLGNLYVMIGDLKSRDKNVKLAEEAYAEAGKYTDGADDAAKITYYIGLGSFLTARTETGKLSPEETRKSLEQSLESLRTAEELAVKNDSTRDLQIIRSETSIAERRLSDLLMTVDMEAAAKLCRDSLAGCQEELKSLNLEEEPYSYVYLKLRIAELSLQLDDILSHNLDDLLKASKPDTNAIKEVLAERLKILGEGASAINQARKFNNGEYADQAQIYYKSALILSRFAILKDDRELFDNAVKLFDAALKEYPENESLLRNIEVAANKAIVLFNAGLSMEADEYLEEAGRISNLYLKEYSSTGYDLYMEKFREIADLCGE